MFRFKYAGRPTEEDLNLGSRVLREVGLDIEDRLTREVGWAEVETGRLGRSLRVVVSPETGEMDPEAKVRKEIGEALLDSLMAAALENPSAPIISASGNLASGGRMSADRIGL